MEQKENAIPSMTPSSRVSEMLSWSFFRVGLYQPFMSVILYEPPVGLVALGCLTHLALSGRLFRLHSNGDADSLLEDGPQQQQSKKEDKDSNKDDDDDDFSWTTGRSLFSSFFLDLDDVAYRRLGGVDYVRQQLVLAALQYYQQQKLQLTTQQEIQQANDEIEQAAVVSIDSQRLHQLELLLCAMKVTGSSHLQFVKEMIHHMSQIQTFTEKNSQQQNSDASSQISTILDIGMRSTELRIMDALVRACRNRLLKNTHRLAHEVKHWNRLIESSHSFWGRIFSLRNQQNDPNVIEQRRLQLAFANAEYRAETFRIGRLQRLLAERPLDLPENVMLDALHQSSKLEKFTNDHDKYDQSEPSTSWWSDSLGPYFSWRLRIGNWVLDGWNLQAAAQHFIKQFAQTASWFLSRLAQPERFSRRVHGQVAIKVLAGPLVKEHDHVKWLEQTTSWLRECQVAVCQTLVECLKAGMADGGADEQALVALQKRWVGDVSVPNVAQDWRLVLQYVDQLEHARRWRRALRLRDATIRQLNVFGLPLAALQVGLVRSVRWAIQPYWPEIRKDASRVLYKTLEILNQRVWVPAKAIYDEIMNQSKGLMSGFGLGLEERSLDYMLRDLGFGDGTAATRQAALERAAAQYEHDTARGLLLSFSSGRLVRLLLVQVQQLKVGMLSALETIDVLVKGNQIHFQIMAAIPAVLIATYGTKFVVRSLWSIRAKDLRPVNAAHAEMTTYLNRLECILLEMSSGETAGLSTETSMQKRKITELLGEAVFCMHRYFVLLGFFSVIVPTRASAEIHQSMIRFMGAFLASTRNDVDGILSSDLSSNFRWIQLIKEQNENLKKFF